MLRELRGRTHEVVTAVAVMPAGRPHALIRHPVTQVTMRAYTDAEIDAAPSPAATLSTRPAATRSRTKIFRRCESYNGCYCNVVGLPLWTTAELLTRAGFDMTHVRAADLLPQCARCPLGPP